MLNRKKRKKSKIYMGDIDDTKSANSRVENRNCDKKRYKIGLKCSALICAKICENIRKSSKTLEIARFCEILMKLW